MLPTDDYAILDLYGTEIFEYVSKVFVRLPSNSDYLMYWCDSIGLSLSWTHAPRNASLESICSCASSDGKLGYHVLPNIGVVMNGLNIIKGRHSPIVLPLILTWLHATAVPDFLDRKGQLIWAYTAVSNESMMGELLGNFNHRGTEFAQFEALDDAARMDIIEAQRTGTMTELLQANLVGSRPRDFGGRPSGPETTCLWERNSVGPAFMRD